jgi:hypothetical protein
MYEPEYLSASDMGCEPGNFGCYGESVMPGLEDIDTVTRQSLPVRLINRGPPHCLCAVRAVLGEPRRIGTDLFCATLAHT